jgi:hypothetical protein
VLKETPTSEILARLDDAPRVESPVDAH